jgi:1,4-dihydroxy-2-naphthoyl-CoA hydrolase
MQKKAPWRHECIFQLSLSEPSYREPKTMSKATPAAARALTDELGNHPIAKLLGIRPLSVDRERIRAEIPITESHMNRGGRVAGGIIMAFGDVLGARGTLINLPPHTRTTTLESKTNFFSGGVGPVIRGEAIPLHIGRTTMVWQTTITDDNGRRLAIVTQTQMVIPTGANSGKPPVPATASKKAGAQAMPRKRAVAKRAKTTRKS